MKKTTKLIAFIALVLIFFAAMLVINIGVVSASAEVPAEYTQTSTTISNGYLKFYHESDGDFAINTTGGNPDSATDNYVVLLYNTTSQILVMVDQSTTLYNGDTYYINADGTKMYSEMTYNGIRIQEYISLSYNTYTGRNDTVELKYVFTNTTNQSKSVGTRILFDTMLGNNDSAPFRIPGVGNLTREAEYTGENIPQTWQAFDNLTNPTVIGSGTFYTDVQERPDKVQFILWGSGRNNDFNNTISGNSFGDSAVNIYYNPITLDAGQSRTVKTWYGLSQFVPITIDLEADLSLTAVAPSELLTSDNQKTYQSNPFSFNSWVKNIGDARATNVKATLVLPSELSVNGSLVKSIGALNVGAEYNISWSIKAALQSEAKTVTYSVILSADGLDDIVYTYDIYLPAVHLTHTLSEWIVDVQPTCTSNGSEYQICTVCDDIINRRYIPALGHDYVLFVTEEPTCTEDGYMGFACTRCGSEKYQDLPAHGHHFGNDDICDICGYVRQNHTHSFDITVVPPTCTTMGYTIYTCSSCGYSYRTNYIEQTGHHWNNGVITVEKTCTADGLKIYTCVDCGATMNEIIPAGHTWSETVTIPATCTTDGSVTKICSVCGAIAVEVIPAGHTWGEDVDLIEATCVDPGLARHTCIKCGLTVDFETAPLGHHFVNGICTRCGIHFIDVVVPYPEQAQYGMYFCIDDIISNYGPAIINQYGVLLDYNQDARINKVGVYLTQDGTMWRRCIACVGDDISYATYVPYLSYDADIYYTGLNSDWINIFRLSEGNDGIWRYNEYTTIGVNLEDRNGNLLLSLYDIGQAGAKTRIFDDLDEMIAWLKGEEECEHQWGSWVIDVQPTATTEGRKHRVCQRCGEVEYAVIPAIGDVDVWDGSIADGFGGGTGTENDPYLIYTAAQLAYLAKSTNEGNSYEGKYFLLMRNLDLNNLEWTPIGKGIYVELNFDSAPNLEVASFRGIFDGNWHIIHNLKISSCDTTYIGLFGCSVGSVFKNIGIDVVDITATVSNSNYREISGGLIGCLQGGVISGCFVTNAEIQNYGTGVTATGILIGVSKSNVTLIEDCYTTGSIAGSGQVGGLLGACYYTDSSTTIRRCYSFSTVHGQSGISSNSVHDIGGICKYDGGDLYIYDSFFVGRLTYNSNYATAPIGGGTLSNNYYVLLDGNANTTTENLQSQYWIESNLGWDFNSVWTFENGYDYPVLQGFSGNGGIIIPPHVHEYVEVERLSSTCTEEGHIKYVCEICNYIYIDTIPALGHNWVTPEYYYNYYGILLPAVLPGCDDPVIRYICLRCGEVIEDPAPGHDWNNGVVTLEPTCTTAGIRLYTCQRCLATKEGYIPPLGHIYDSVLTKEATCTEPGEITHTCRRCGDIYITYIYSEHYYQLVEHVEPTCTVDGYDLYRCAYCLSEYVEHIPGGHNYVAVITRVASPTDDGIITYTCTRCGDQYIEIIPARPNATILLVQDRLPWTESVNTALLERLKQYGYITGWDITTTAELGSVNLALYNVIYIANDQTTATYNQLGTFNEMITQYAMAGGVVVYGACDHGWAAGDISYALPGGVIKSNYYSWRNYIANPTHCVVTGVLTDRKALTNELLYSTYSSHTYFNNLPSDAIVILEDANAKPTLVEYSLGNGLIIASGLTWEYTYVRNMVNGTSFAKSVYDDLLVYAVTRSSVCSHIWAEGEIVPPTCTEYGYTRRVCSECGEELKDNFVAPLGHDWSEWEVTILPTATTDGLERRECYRCGAEELRIIQAHYPQAIVSSNVNSVLVGQEIVFEVTIAYTSPTNSMAIEPIFDNSVFEFVSAEWRINGFLQNIDSQRAVIAFISNTDVNGTVLRFTLRAIAPSTGSLVSCDVKLQSGTIVLDSSGKVITVVNCLHEYKKYECIDENYHGYFCMNCGYCLKIHAHVYDDGYDKFCNICGYERPHLYGVWIEEVPPTCEEYGVVGHYYCSICQKFFDANYNEIIDILILPLGHKYGSWIHEIPATCTDDREKGQFV